MAEATGQRLDAYCGVGAVALPAGQVRKVMGIEAFKPAFKDAQATACLNGLGKTRFLAGLMEEVMPTLTIRFPRSWTRPAGVAPLGAGSPWPI